MGHLKYYTIQKAIYQVKKKQSVWTLRRIVQAATINKYHAPDWMAASARSEWNRIVPTIKKIIH